ncbi:hypothetical protein AVEN_6723-1, partial [Araneus ventricosus]
MCACRDPLPPPRGLGTSVLFGPSISARIRRKQFFQRNLHFKWRFVGLFGDGGFIVSYGFQRKCAASYA